MHRQAGIALITAIWFVALVGLMATTALTITRASARMTAQQSDVLRAELLADTAIKRAILGLMEDDPRHRWRIDGSSRIFEFHGARASVTLRDESGRVDLNGADVWLLSALFAANGAEVLEARSYAARIVDWRDTDDTESEQGAEMESYRASGLSYGPRNGPFESVGEAKLVSGIPPGILNGLMSSLTVYTAQAGVNSLVAPPPVMAALRWADARQWGGRRWLLQDPQAGILGAGALGTGNVVRVCAVVERDRQFDREAVLRLTGNAREPYLVLAWNAGLHCAQQTGREE